MKYIFLAFIAVMSLFAFFAYAIDKKKAEQKKWRTPEKMLLGLSFFGGAVGGYIAMFLFHHKTKKWYFHLVNLLGLAWQIAAAIYLFIA
jgi:uncharacterized membrane protein YsdA (DUF1294 family)